MEEVMQYVRLGGSGLNVSRICLGTMNMGSKEWKPWIFDESESEPIIKHAIDKGVNFIDLADFYSTGVNEEIVCNVINRMGLRKELILTTKCGYPIGGGQNNQGHSRAHVMDAVHGSLKRMNTDYIDIFMLHYFDINTPIEETWSTLNDMVRQGKVRYLPARPCIPGSSPKFWPLATSTAGKNRSICSFSSQPPIVKKSAR